MFILKEKLGVTLAEIRPPSSVIGNTYHLQSKRTPETWSFKTLDAAESAFDVEVAQCCMIPPKSKS